MTLVGCQSVPTPPSRHRVHFSISVLSHQDPRTTRWLEEGRSHAIRYDWPTPVANSSFPARLTRHHLSISRYWGMADNVDPGPQLLPPCAATNRWYVDGYRYERERPRKIGTVVVLVEQARGRARGDRSRSLPVAGQRIRMGVASSPNWAACISTQPNWTGLAISKQGA